MVLVVPRLNYWSLHISPDVPLRDGPLLKNESMLTPERKINR